MIFIYINKYIYVFVCIYKMHSNNTNNTDKK